MTLVNLWAFNPSLDRMHLVSLGLMLVLFGLVVFIYEAVLCIRAFLVTIIENICSYPALSKALLPTLGARRVVTIALFLGLVLLALVVAEIPLHFVATILTRLITLVGLIALTFRSGLLSLCLSFFLLLFLASLYPFLLGLF